jgi:hypothetical protein
LLTVRLTSTLVCAAMSVREECVLFSAGSGTALSTHHS